MELALIENLQRQDLNPVEEALGYQTLMGDYGLTQEETAARVGKSRPAVANALRLLNLPKEVSDLVAAGILSAGHARAILSLVKESDREVLANLIVENDLSVRAAEEAARRMNRIFERENAESEDDKKAEKVRVDYAAHLEKRLMQTLGRKVQLRDTKKKKTLTLYIEDNEDLEGILTLLCGKEFLSEI
jgi:ParB family chromosome partitioning protein